MERTIHEKRMLHLLNKALHVATTKQGADQEIKELFQEMQPEDWNELLKLSQQHKVTSLVCEGLGKEQDLGMPEGLFRYFQQKALENSLKFYQKMNLCSSIAEQLSALNVNGAFLKGIILSSMYPVPESRTFGDIDLFIPDEKDLERVCQCFSERGFEKYTEDMTDYHVSYIYADNGISSDVELHYRLTGHFYNGDFDETLSRIYEEMLQAESFETLNLFNQEFQMLPYTAQAMHLLMHMFQHFMNKGFGIRLLCDWVVLWEKYGDRIDAERFRKYVRELHLDVFLDIISTICRRYLGLPLERYGLMKPAFPETESEKELPEEFLQDIFDGGDFGHLDVNRITVTSRKNGIKANFLEMHRQMRKHYPQASRWWILWPALWVIATSTFLYNNRFKRKISTREVFKAGNRRNKLVQKLKVFKE